MKSFITAMLVFVAIQPVFAQTSQTQPGVRAFSGPKGVGAALPSPSSVTGKVANKTASSDSTRRPDDPPGVGSGVMYYVDSAAGSDSNDGRSPERAWKTVAKVNSHRFAPGDVIRFRGAFSEERLANPGNGTVNAPILLVGEGPQSGRAVIGGIELSSGQHLIFRNFEASGGERGLIVIRPKQLTGPQTESVRFVRFDNIFLHDARQGVSVNGPKHEDITFVDTQICRMRHDGILLDDAAGNRFSFIRGSITDTGMQPPDFGVHGVYASGGHGHLFHGVRFSNNAKDKLKGQSISVRRGSITIRHCTFDNPTAIGNFNEDEGGVSPYTGSPSRDLFYFVYRNVFRGGCAIYQGGANDQGVPNPGNTWLVFNNTFINSQVNFASPSGHGQFYNIYMRNNAFVGTKVLMKAPAAGRAQVLSHNGWSDSGEPMGTANRTTNPRLDAQFSVTSKAYQDAGTATIHPALSLTADPAKPLGYAGRAPDIGHTER